MGLLIVVGLFARLAAFVASGQMAVAYLAIISPPGSLPIQNKGELAAMFSFAFFLLISSVVAGLRAIHRRRGGGR